MTVQDMIDHLSKMDRTLPLVSLWDEGGYYFDHDNPPVEQDIVKYNSPFNKDGKKWQDEEIYSDEDIAEIRALNGEGHAIVIYKVIDRKRVVVI